MSSSFSLDLLLRAVAVLDFAEAVFERAILGISASAIRQSATLDQHSARQLWTASELKATCAAVKLDDMIAEASMRLAQAVQHSIKSERFSTAGARSLKRARSALELTAELSGLKFGNSRHRAGKAGVPHRSAAEIGMRFLLTPSRLVLLPGTRMDYFVILSPPNCCWPAFSGS